MERLTAAMLAAEIVGEPVTLTPGEATNVRTVWRALQNPNGVKFTDGGFARPKMFGPGHVLVFPGGDTYPTQDDADSAAAITAHYAHPITTA